MIRRSALIATAAAFLSVILHILGFGIFAVELAAPDKSERPADAVELTRTFEDFAEAAESPVEPEPAETPDPPVEEAVEPERAEIPTSDALVASDTPERVTSPDTGTVSTEQPNRVDADVTRSVEQPAPATASPVPPAATPPVATSPPVEAAQPFEEFTDVPEPVEPVAPPPDRLAALPAPATPPVVSVPVETTPETPTIPEEIVEPAPDAAEAEADFSDLTIAVSKRPRLPQRRPPPEPANVLESFRNFDNLRNPQQTVDSPLTLYQQQGVDPFSVESGQTQSGGRGSGNADTTNYAGQVLVHLNRAQAVYVSVRGFAQVFFQINADGSLAWVNIVDSSGSPEIERAAREQVRRAAPFPRPPGGTSERLSFYYQNG